MSTGFLFFKIMKRDIKNHSYYKQGWQDALAACERQLKQTAFQDGVEAGIKQAQEKYKLQNVVLDAMKTQMAGMEMLTRMSNAICLLNGHHGIM